MKNKEDTIKQRVSTCNLFKTPYLRRFQIQSDSTFIVVAYI